MGYIQFAKSRLAPESRIPNSIGLAFLLGMLWEALMESSLDNVVDLFSDLDNENKKYINSIDFLEFIAHATNNTLSDICRYLLIHNFHESVSTFHQNYLGIMEKCVCNLKEYDLAFIDYTKDILDKGLECFEYSGDTYSNAYKREDYEDYYWLKSDFFEFSAIDKLNVTEDDFYIFWENRSVENFTEYLIEQDITRHENKLKERARHVSEDFFNQQNEYGLNDKGQTYPNSNAENSMIENLKQENEMLKVELDDIRESKPISQNTVNGNVGCGKPSIGHFPSEYYQKHRDELLIEVEKLKLKLLEKEQQIKELGSSKPAGDTNLLSLICDESATERYSPDLVLSIKLWEHIYITNPKKDSHSNKADTWLKDNTGYDITKKAGSASKIREVITPFIKWSPHRDKNHKK